MSIAMFMANTFMTHCQIKNLEDSQVATLSMGQDDTAAKISELEDKIDKLQKMVDSFSNKS